MDKILLLLENKSNKHLLSEWLRKRYAVIEADSVERLSEQIDLCIVDGPIIDKYSEPIRLRREKEKGVLLPILAVISKADVTYVTRHLWKSIDELVTTPIQKIELQARVEILLRTRKLTFQVHHLDQILLDETRARLQLAVRAGNIGLWDWDLKTNQVFFSAEWKEQIGYQEHEIGNAFDEWQSRVHPEDIDRALQLIYASINTPNLSYKAEFRLRHRNGSYRWILSQGTVLRNEQGEPYRMTGAHIDISEQKESERLLRVGEERYRLAQTLAGSGTWEWVIATNEVFWSNDTELLFGLSPGKFSGKLEDVIKQIHPDDLDRWRESVRVCVEDGKEHKIDFRIIKLDGTVRWMAVYGNAERDIKGKALRMLGVIRDITDRKQAEVELASGRKFLRKVIDTVPSMIFAKNRAGQFVLGNEAVAKTYGTTPEGIIGKTDWDYNPNIEEVNHFVLDDLKVINTQEKKLIPEEPVTHADGEIRWYTTVKVPLLNDDGTCDTVLGVAADITEIRKTEESLKLSEERFRKVFENAVAGIAIEDLDGHFVQINPEYANMLGYSEEEFRQITYASIVHPEDREANVIELRRLIVGEQSSFEVENRYIHKDGHVVWVHKSVSLLYDNNGKPAYSMALVNDITDRKRAQEALQASEEHLRATLDSITDGVIATDSTGGILRINPMAQRLTGWSASQSLGKPLADVFVIVNADTGKAMENSFSAMLNARGSVVQTNHTMLISRDGARYHIDHSEAPIRDARGLVTGMVLVFRDVTEDYALRDAIIANEERFRIISELVSDFAGCFLPTEDVTPKMEWGFGALPHLTGYSIEELGLHDGFFGIIYPEDLKEVHGFWQRQLHEGKPFSIEFRIQTKSGAIRWIRGYGLSTKNRRGEVRQYFAVQDITERKNAEQSLKSSIHDKEILLQEVYHRTKNNMGVISSFLELQAASVDNPEVDRIIYDSTTRIRTMALAHEMIYKGKSLSHVNMRDYIVGLAKLLMSGSGISPQKVDLRYAIDEVEMLIDIAIPCGLIINELLSNSFKHAFPNGRKGIISIALHRRGIRNIDLTISDNGVGLPQGFDIMKPKTLGVQLIFQIARHQLHGTATAESNHGLRWRIEFPEDLYSERV